MGEMSSITAIIPTYNRAGFLGQTLDALRRQTRPIDEIIVWDDGSTDGTLDVVRQCGKDIRYFRTANGGKSRALNAAMSEAKGDCIWICDDDDLATPQAAAVLSAMLSESPQAGIAGGAYRRFRNEDSGRVEQGPGYWPDLSTGSPIRHVLEDIFLFQNAMLVRREVYGRVGGFREDLSRSMDYEMLVRLGVAAPIALTEETIFLQRKHDGDRGPVAARHAAGQSDQVWKAADRAIFDDFRDRIPMQFYDAMFEAPDPAHVRRAALLQRGCVYARRTDWPAALEDFEAAVRVSSEPPLSEVETAIVRRAMGGKHGIAEAFAEPVRRRLVRLARHGAVGAGIGAGLARGLRWRLRQAFGDRDIGRATVTARLAASLVIAGGRRPNSTNAPSLTERRALSLDAHMAIGAEGSGIDASSPDP